MTDAYHSALKHIPPAEATPLVMHGGENGNAFVWDLNDGFPPAVQDQADVLYSDLPWSNGFGLFAIRAGIGEQKSTYREFVRKVGAMVRESGKPAVLVTGKHAIDLLRPDHTAAVKLNDLDAVACLWGIRPWGSVLHTEAVISMLAAKYECVGDFCCGYGRAGRIFAERGKRYVMCDLNPKCIGYIAKQAWA